MDTEYKHLIGVDQLVLEHWVGKRLDPASVQNTGQDRRRLLNHTFDPADALLVSLIADMNPGDPAVKKWMYRGHFLLTADYVIRRLPLMGLQGKSARIGLYRRLRWLRLMGILDCLNRTADGSKILAYYRLSSSFWRIHKRRHDMAARAASASTSKPVATSPRASGSKKSRFPQGTRPLALGLEKPIQHRLLTTSAPSAAAKAASGSTESAVSRQEGAALASEVLLELARLGEAKRERRGR